MLIMHDSSNNNAQIIKANLIFYPSFIEASLTDSSHHFCPMLFSIKIRVRNWEAVVSGFKTK